MHPGAALRRVATKDADQPEPDKQPDIAPDEIISGWIQLASTIKSGINSEMEINGYKFELVSDIQPDRNPDGSLREFMPQKRYLNSRRLPLNAYGAGPFCKFKISNRYAISGVYVLTIDGVIMYVGECANLTARFNAGYGNISPKNCFKGGQETNCRLNNLIYRSAVAEQTIALWFLPTTDYKQIEATLRAARRMAWNRV